MTDIEEIRIGPSESLTPAERPPSWLRQADAVSPAAVRIRLREAAFRVALEQASATLDEVGGLLIGEAVSWRGKLYVDIEAALPGAQTQAGPAHVTFTAETWAALLRRKEEEFPTRSIVGWYHSHPQMGIFLSGLDLSLHRHFFPQPWHVALVVNGQDHKAGLFVWSNGDIQPEAHFVWAPTQGAKSGISLRSGEHPFTYEVRLSRRGPRAPSLLLWLLALPIGALFIALWLERKITPRRQRRVGDRS